MNSRETQALTSLERLGADRFLTFLRVVAPEAHCGAVRFFLEELEAGATVDEIAEWFDVPVDLVRQVIDFAARSLRVSADAR